MDFGFFNHQAADSIPKSSHAFDLPRLPSVFTLTFDELQSSGLGKDYGSMNMDELMKSIWSTEDTHHEADGGQGSLAISRNLSLKTVDQVWKDAVKDECRRPCAQQQRQRTLGETTLEEFLAMAGVVKEGDAPGAAELTIGNNTCSSPLNISEFDTTGIITPQHQKQHQQQQQEQEMVFSKEAAAAVTFVPQVPMAVDRMGGFYRMGEGVPPGQNGTIPCSFAINNGGTRGRRWTSTEKVMERRHKRMIKNRESAARSRARKQAHTLELEAEVEKVKAVNRELRRKQAEMLEIQRNQMAEEMNHGLGAKNKRGWRALRRTSTGPW